jgi:pyridinium-3,5-biscarboxylic acid mononucleotide synthase
MNNDVGHLRELLERFKAGELDMDAALKRLENYPTTDLGFAKIDTHRPSRRGIPEVVFCESKTVEHIVKIVRAIEEAGQNILCTRVRPHQAKCVCSEIDGLTHNAMARTLVKIVRPREKVKGKVLVLSAGTSDIPVAEEAVSTLEFLGDDVERAYDVGVAGIHRLLDRRDAIEQAAVIIVVAGMEGALPSVVAGLARSPVIAVPTSVGYGAAFGGLAALLSMLNACSGGIAVVNIDNGFGAAQFADLILRHGK